MPEDYDGLHFAKKLQNAGFAREQAEALAELVRADVVDKAAKATALEAMEKRLLQHVERVEERTRHRIEQAERSLIIKLGGLIVVATGVLATILKLFGK